MKNPFAGSPPVLSDDVRLRVEKLVREGERLAASPRYVAIMRAIEEWQRIHDTPERRAAIRTGSVTSGPAFGTGYRFAPDRKTPIVVNVNIKVASPDVVSETGPITPSKPN